MDPFTLGSLHIFYVPVAASMCVPLNQSSLKLGIRGPFTCLGGKCLSLYLFNSSFHHFHHPLEKGSSLAYLRRLLARRRQTLCGTPSENSTCLPQEDYLVDCILYVYTINHYSTKEKVQEHMHAVYHVLLDARQYGLQPAFCCLGRNRQLFESSTCG